jgi:hypothetical protein
MQLQTAAPAPTITVIQSPTGAFFMSQGSIVSIFITPKGGQPLHPVGTIRAVPGQGLEGDRYFLAAGTFMPKSGKLSPSQEATLIESEAIEALKSETGIELDPCQSRRNILTRGIRLNDLVGKEFSVGAARMKGIRLAEPCNHLESLTQAGVREGLTHRGGLRAQILTEGIIRVGDAIVVDQHAETAACAS